MWKRKYIKEKKMGKPEKAPMLMMFSRPFVIKFSLKEKIKETKARTEKGREKKTFFFSPTAEVKK